MNKFAFGISGKSQTLFEKWKYLLFQEQCRLCKRMIHPMVEKMNFENYGPPGKYFYYGNEIVSDALCQFCLPNVITGHPVINSHQFVYAEKSQQLFVSSAAIFKEPVNELILRLKYSNDVLLAKDLSCLMLRSWHALKERFEHEIEDGSVCLVPVPLHKKRLHERGYNQAELIASCMGNLLNIRVEDKLLCRVRNTVSQQKLSKAERWINVKEAFMAKNDCAFLGKQVVLIDDVCTSGATLVECSKAVKSAGALAVYGLSAAFVF